MRLKAAAISDRGAIRAKNEDNLIVDGSILPEIHNEREELLRELSTAQRSLFGVFDGMGGFSSGETASRLTAETAKKLWEERGQDTPPEQLTEEICAEANRNLCEEMVRRSNALMGSTAAMLLFGDDAFHLCNVGDSPIFRLRGGVLEQLSYEHTERETYEAVTGKKAEPGRKFGLTQNIGMSEDEISLSPYHLTGELKVGDTFLICSDGVTDMLQPEEIAELLGLPDETAAVRKIVDRSLEAGGRDNITAIVLRSCREPGLIGRILKAVHRKGE